MQGFPDTAEQFEREKKAAISADSRKAFEAIADNPAVKAVLMQLRHTCYHGIALYPEGEPITFGHTDRFGDVKGDAEYFITKSNIHGRGLPNAVHILDALGAVVWTQERDANA